MWDSDDVAGFCEAHHRALYGALFLYCGSRETAEDLTQETLLRVWRNWASVSTMERPDRWALRVAFNLAKSGFRRLRVARRIAELADVDPPPDHDPTDALAVRAAVATLPPRQRAAIVLRYFNDFSVADTAAVMGCAEGTVKALTSQAVANLRARLTADLDLTIPNPELDHA
ncbi:MAG TPA: sigma-70 family RNA polymerase sigma factor [Acidimicrobiia bacterium]|jgi:RNA polymerase sigma-70 factor (ECF subfamily)|nr:sigma-70 family RNA polymerase sigma factor [Acidimicrobiia bacterium]